MVMLGLWDRLDMDFVHLCLNQGTDKRRNISYSVEGTVIDIIRAPQGAPVWCCGAGAPFGGDSFKQRSDGKRNGTAMKWGEGAGSMRTCQILSPRICPPPSPF